MARIAPLLVALSLSLLEGAAAAAEVKGLITLSPDFQLTPLFDAPGYWQLPNDAMEVQPPLVDPRTEMVAELRGSGLPSKSLVKPELRIEDSRMVPQVVPVKPNEKVTVLNQDWMAHIVETQGLRAKRLAPGDSVQHAFAKPGIYQLKGTEVPHLVAEIFVSDAPLVTVPDASGTFRFPDIPSGSYNLQLWYRGKVIYKEPVAAKGAIRVDIQLKRRGKD
jgi:plastocyanin